MSAHRFVYEHFRGPIPRGMVLDHLCRVRRCVNPSHLEAVIQAVNARRGSRCRIPQEVVNHARRRIKSGEKIVSVARDIGMDPSYLSKAYRGRRRRDVREVVKWLKETR